MDVGAQLLLALIREKQAREFVRYQLHKDMFFGTEVKLFDFVAAHLAKHHQLPQMETVKDQFPDLGKAGEPPKFYLEQVEQRYTHKTLNGVLLDANGLMKEQDSFGALDMVEEAVQLLRSRALQKDITDFGSSTIVQDEISRIKLLNEDPGIQLGWPTFDAMSSGLRGGDLVSLVGRMALGKTWFLLYSALHAWRKQHKNVLAVSMEMDVLSIAQRLMGITSKVNSKHIRLADLTTVELSRITKAAKEGKKLPSHLWLMDGNLNAEVDQVFTVVRQMKPDVLLIDGAYLMGHPNPRLDKFKRVDANVELIKRRASEMGIPAVLSYQFNRQAVKKYKGGKNEGGAIEDIAYSDAIGQISSAVLGLHQEDSVETANQRIINVLKCRTEKPGKFTVKWDFYGMDFSELLPEKASQLKFV